MKGIEEQNLEEKNELENTKNLDDIDDIYINEKNEMKKSIVVTESKEGSVGTVFLNGVSLAASIGAIASAIILIFGKLFLKQIFQINHDFLSETTNYLKIRSLSLPSVLLNYIIFGFSIALQDITAPILSIITVFFVNVFGDYVLVGNLGYGLSGAAIATTISSYLGISVSYV